MAAVPSVAFPFKGSDTNSYAGQTVPLDAAGNVPVSFAAQPLPAGAATAARQPAFGVAGTAAADVLTIQGVAAGVALPADTVVRAAAANRGALSTVKAASAAVSAGGAGYAVGDTITNAAGVFTVGTVTSGSVTAVTVTTATALTATPSGALAQTATSGAGTGCTLTPSYAAAALQFAAANAGRRGFAVQNQSGGNLWLSGSGTATADQNSLLLAPGDYFESAPHHTGTGALSIIGTAAGQPFYAREF